MLTLNTQGREAVGRIGMLVIATAIAAPALAQDDDTGAAVASDVRVLERERLTGDWWGYRSSLERSGVTIGGQYVAEFSSVLDGGINERGSFRNLLTLDAELDLDTLVGLEGGTAFFQYLSVNPETGGSADSGDIQVYSNIENDVHLDVVFEAWYEQLLLDDRLRLKIGKLDANSEFAFVDVAGEFANSSAGFSPTVFTFPSYPDSAMSVSLFGRVIDNDAIGLTLGYGLFDGAAADGVPTGRQGPASFFSGERSSDLFHVFQSELTWERLCGCERWLRDGRLTSGLWYHSGDLDRFDGGSEDGALGFFLTAEQRVFATDDEDGGVYAFAQVALSDGDVSEIEGHFAGGLVLRGICDLRPDDSAGVYLSLADLSDDPAAGFDDDEFVVDVYYRAQLTPWVSVQPELQYIVNPSGDTTIDDAVVGGLRIEVVF